MHVAPLSGRKACDRVLRHGTVWKGKMFTARWMCGFPKNLTKQPTKETLYLGTFASAKLDPSAVRRNRMRRRCREAFRTAAKDLPDSVMAQLLLSPRSASLDAPFSLIQSEVSAVLALLTRACRQPKNPGT